MNQTTIKYFQTTRLCVLRLDEEVGQSEANKLQMLPDRLALPLGLACTHKASSALHWATSLTAQSHVFAIWPGLCAIQHHLFTGLTLQWHQQHLLRRR